jgi:dephospho-CoA kinase
LALAAFRSLGEQKKLNHILHPAVRKAVARWVRSMKGRMDGRGLVVVEVPLVFERGYNRKFDGVVSISSPKVMRHRRLVRRGWDLAEVRRREKLQWSQARKDQNADWIIPNRGTRRDLVSAVDGWLERFK